MAPPAPPESLASASASPSPLHAALTEGVEPLKPVDDCPVTALGHRDGVYWYIAAGGELRSLHHDRHKRLGILSLFGGKSFWLAERWPVFDREGQVKPGSFAEGAVSAFLMRLCHRAGLWDAATPQRGPGVWRDGDGILVHAGDGLFLAGGWEDPGQRRADAIYPAYPRAQRPAFDQPATAAEGREMLHGFKAWAYETATAPDLLLGFVGAAMLGGAPDWRTHTLTVGARGSGKTWLSNFVSAQLGGGATDSNDSTAAGIQQRLTGEARAIILDEQEADEAGAERIRAVIRLLRLMASGKGAQGLRGSAGGQSRAFSVTGCAYLAAILPPPLEPQDRSRITVIRLRPLATGAATVGQSDRVQELIARARLLSPRLRARAILGWPRFREAFALYRAAFLTAGVDPRDADRIGTLLAGRDLLVADETPPADFAAEEVGRFLDLIEDAAEQKEEGEGEQCLTHLYTSPADLWRSGERETVAELILKALGLKSDPAHRLLGKLGLRVEDVDDKAHTRLLVANQHVALEKIFDGTRWAKGGWRQALLYLGGGVEKGHRFNGVLSRATVVAKQFLPVDWSSDPS